MKKIVLILLLLLATAGAYWLYASKLSTHTSKVLPYVPDDTVLFLGAENSINVKEILALQKSAGMSLEDQLTYIELILAKESAGSPKLIEKLRSFHAFLENTPGLQFDAAFYTVGLTPVFRIDLPLTAGFWSQVDEIETELGLKGEVKSLDGITYRQYDLNAELNVILGLDGSQLVLAFRGSHFSSDANLGYVLGSVKPEQSIVQSGKLADLNNKHDFIEYSIWFIDFEDLVALITGSNDTIIATNVRSQLAASYAIPLASIQTESCQSEIGQLTANWPRLSAGYTHFDSSGSNIKMVFEGNNPSIISELKPIRGHISTTLSQSTDPFIFAQGLNVSELGPVLTDMKQRLIGTDYACEPLAQMEQGFNQLNPAYITMAAGSINGLQGVGISIDIANLDYSALNGTDQNAKIQQLMNLDATLVISADDTAQLIDMAGAFYPPLSQASLEDGSAAVAIATPLDTSVYISLRGHDIVIANGLSAESRATNAKNNSNIDANGLFFEKIDMGTYMKALASIAAAFVSSQSPQSPQSPQTLADIALMKNLYKNIDLDIEVSFDIKNSGFEINAQTTNKISK